MAQQALHAVEPRLAHTGGQAAHGGLGDAAHAVLTLSGCQNGGADGLGGLVRQGGEIRPLQGGHVRRRTVGKGAIPRAAAAKDVCAHGDAHTGKGGQQDGARRHQRRGDASGEVSAAPPVLIAVVFAVGGVVRVGGAGKAVGIIPAAGVLVGDDDGQRRAGGAPLKDAAEYLIVVRLLPGGIQRRGGTAAGQLAAEEIPVHRQTGCQTVQHRAHGSAVALAEQRQRDRLSKGVFHAFLSSQRRSISSGVIVSMRKVPGSSTSTAVTEPEAAFLSCSR